MSREMKMVEVPEEFFRKAEVRGVCGFEFRYDPSSPEYGVGVITDGTIPQIANIEEAGRVAKKLQRAIFGVPAKQQMRLHW